MQPLLQVRNLRKSYGSLEVLHGISIDIAPGEVVAIIGASGSGKSTFLRCLNLLETPTSGELCFDGKPVEYGEEGWGWRREKQLQWLRSQIGMVFQSFNLWPHKTVIENIIEAPMIVKNVPRYEAVAEAEDLLRRIGLAEKRDAFPSRLSGGQQQRVAIIRSLAMKPKLMLFDEVTSSLDPQLVGEVLNLMASLAAEGMTMLAVTHEMSFARSVSTRTIFFDGGVIAEEGPSHVVLNHPRQARTQRFLSRTLPVIGPAVTVAEIQSGQARVAQDLSAGA
ncbi:amino acid ABC transporter ATP-binding protein [Dongia deserti]|uniref:amino acid ABC transporter ATP-binding protein n=1 Tax=Dongia deserti TaxID=2268030 RepID=UPI000E65E1EF|nr:amino acid ABC transporter ATP-binding protein [Dongia deserti]